MFAWFDGPGKAFRDPLAGSTNYLSAYDRQGNLRRAGRRDFQAEEEEAEPSEEEILKQEEQEGIDVEEMAERAESRAAQRREKEAVGKALPKERDSDLQPYPLNSNFRSQPVLSEELREEIYHQIVVRKMDLQGVSAAYGIDMRRVAAVIRLKTIEKQWQNEVSNNSPLGNISTTLL